MPVVEPLLLNGNEHSDKVLKTMCTTETPSAKHLAILQHAAHYYQCLVTKRMNGNMSTQNRDVHAMTNYKSFTVPAFLCWIKQERKIDLPTWLTKDIMGAATKKGTKLQLYRVPGGLWPKYNTCGREIRRDFNPNWDSFLGSDSNLPSGEQADGQWANLQDKLFYIEKNNAAKKKELTAAKNSRKSAPVVLDGADGEGLDGGKGAEEDEDPTDEPGSEISAAAAKWLATQKAAAAAEKRAAGGGGSKAGTQGAVGAAGATEGLASLGDEPPAGFPDLPRWLARRAALSMAADAGLDCIKQEEEDRDVEGGDGSASDGEDERNADLGGPRPEDWMHTVSLVFALFGRPAGQGEDVDLQVQEKSGPRRPSSRTRSEGSASRSASPAVGSSGVLAKRNLQSMTGAGGAGGSSSRADVKKEKHALSSKAKKDKEDESLLNLKRRVLENMLSPPTESKSSAELRASVAVLTKAVVSRELLDQEAAQRARWQQSVDAKEAKLKMLERRGKGETAAAVLLEEELEHLYDNPVIAPLPVAASDIAPLPVAAPDVAPLPVAARDMPSLKGIPGAPAHSLSLVGGGGGAGGDAALVGGARGGVVNFAVPGVPNVGAVLPGFSRTGKATLMAAATEVAVGVSSESQGGGRRDEDLMQSSTPTYHR